MTYLIAITVCTVVEYGQVACKRTLGDKGLDQAECVELIDPVRDMLILRATERGVRLVHLDVECEAGVQA